MFIQERLINKAHALREALKLLPAQGEVARKFHPILKYIEIFNPCVKTTPRVVPVPYNTNNPELYQNYEPDRHLYFYSGGRRGYLYTLKTEYWANRPKVFINAVTYYYDVKWVREALVRELYTVDREIRWYKMFLAGQIAELQARLAKLQ